MFSTCRPCPLANSVGSRHPGPGLLMPIVTGQALYHRVPSYFSATKIFPSTNRTLQVVTCGVLQFQAIAQRTLSLGPKGVQPHGLGEALPLGLRICWWLERGPLPWLHVLTWGWGQVPHSWVKSAL